jgi:APA family basic amino acid/polyamine antiporter
MSLFRTKPISHQAHGATQLKRCLSTFDLTLLGIGAIIGAGIFVLTGVAAATEAGPAVICSYLIAGLACTFTALSYAELASSIGGCGSAYGYAYAGLGELVAWFVGWALLIEYGVITATVAAGWSGYVTNVLTVFGIALPKALSAGFYDGGIVNLPAMLIVAAIGILLTRGARQSARFNAAIVFIKFLAIAVFIAIAAQRVNLQNWHPFVPFGWHGVVNGAALVFFAYIGFDAVSTAGEEAINPQRSLPIGIITSLIVCTLLYMLVAGLLTGIVPYPTLNVSSPVSNALLMLHYRVGAGIVAAGAIAGLTTVILVDYYGLTRIFLAMTRDGLLPAALAKINPRTQTPTRLILFSGIAIMLLAGLFPLNILAELVNIGTLTAFCIVCGGVIVMRYTQPDLPRPFRVPASPLLPALGIVFCFYLMLHLSSRTWYCFAVWISAGFLVYFLYGRRHSVLAAQQREAVFPAALKV